VGGVAGPLRTAWLRPRQTDLILDKGQFRSRLHHPFPGIVVRQRFFGIFWPLFLAGSERLRDNRRMTETTLRPDGSALGRNSGSSMQSSPVRISPAPATTRCWAPFSARCRYADWTPSSPPIITEHMSSAIPCSLNAVTAPSAAGRKTRADTSCPVLRRGVMVGYNQGQSCPLRAGRIGSRRCENISAQNFSSP